MKCEFTFKNFLIPFSKFLAAKYQASTNLKNFYMFFAKFDPFRIPEIHLHKTFLKKRITSSSKKNLFFHFRVRSRNILKAPKFAQIEDSGAAKEKWRSRGHFGPRFSAGQNVFGQSLLVPKTHRWNASLGAFRNKRISTKIEAQTRSINMQGWSVGQPVVGWSVIGRTAARPFLVEWTVRAHSALSKSLFFASFGPTSGQFWST